MADSNPFQSVLPTPPNPRGRQALSSTASGGEPSARRTLTMPEARLASELLDQDDRASQRQRVGAARVLAAATPLPPTVAAITLPPLPRVERVVGAFNRFTASMASGSASSAVSSASSSAAPSAAPVAASPRSSGAGCTHANCVG